jgi:hypothetical protein
LYNAEAAIMELRQYAPTTPVKIRLLGGEVVDCLGLDHEVVEGKMTIVFLATNEQEEVAI